ncbi:MAG: VCBS repeat-containing protein [Planctomycetales bacterium]|nr:VCBS repeat-containing protein [Planctomycetales bacterium]
MLDIVTETQFITQEGASVVVRTHLPSPSCVHPDIVDATGDGRNNLVCAGQFGLRVSEYDVESNSFTPLFRRKSPFVGYESFVADFDLDGTPEIGGITRRNGSGVGAAKRTLTGYEYQRFYAAHTVSPISIDADPAVDMIGYDAEQAQFVWYRNRVFSDRLTIDEEIRVGSVLTADVDGDGDDDLIAIGREPRGLFWYEATGPGEWLDRKQIPLKGGNDIRPLALSVVDIDNDDKDEVLTLSWLAVDRPRNLETLSLEMDGWTSSVTEITTESTLNTIDTLDWNGDGFEDLVLSSNRRAAPYHWLQFSPSRRQFVSAGTTQDRYYTPIVVDLDGDGDSDIASSIFFVDAHPQHVWFENSPDRDNLVAPQQLPFSDGEEVCDIRAAADLDNDGRVELFCSQRVFSLNDNQQLVVNERFTDEDSSLRVSSNVEFTPADIDLDGRIDIPIAGGACQ